jgi:hypothetical protein
MLLWLALIPAIFVVDRAVVLMIPRPEDSGQPIVSWSGTTASLTTATNGNTLAVADSYFPPRPGALGFCHPFARASLSCVLTDSTGTWAAPPGTSQEEVIDRAWKAGVVVADPSHKWLLVLPGRAEQEFFGVPEGKNIPVGTYRHLVWSALAFDAVHAVLLVMPVLAGLSVVRMVFTTRAERRALRLAKALCPRCRYDRSGLGEGAACPKCGETASVIIHQATSAGEPTSHA